MVTCSLMSSQDFTAAYDRICAILNISNQTALAKKLDITQPAIASCVRRKSIPASWQIKLWRSHDLNPDWILHGDAYKQYLVPVDAEVYYCYFQRLCR